MAVDFLAKYGIDDKMLAAGLKEIEGRAGRHAREVGRKTTSEWDAATKKTGEKLFGFKGVGIAAFSAIGTAATLAGKSVLDYAERNSMVGSELERLRNTSREVWTSIGRDISSGVVQSGLDGFIRRVDAARTGLVDWLAVKMGGDPAGVNSAMRAQETQDALAKANTALRESQARQMDARGDDPVGSARIRADLELQRKMASSKQLLGEMRLGGLGTMANTLEQAWRNEKAAAIEASERARDKAFLTEQDKKAADERQLRSARDSAATLLEQNELKLFGMNASQKQLDLAETRLRYEKQIRDVLEDQNLFDAEKVDVKLHLERQRESELDAIFARRGERAGRSIALGSSIDPRQAFAPIVNEERNDRKKAQEKFDRMVAELRKIRDNTGKAQAATYQ